MRKIYNILRQYLQNHIKRAFRECLSSGGLYRITKNCCFVSELVPLKVTLCVKGKVTWMIKSEVVQKPKT